MTAVFPDGVFLIRISMKKDKMTKRMKFFSAMTIAFVWSVLSLLTASLLAADNSTQLKFVPPDQKSKQTSSLELKKPSAPSVQNTKEPASSLKLAPTSATPNGHSGGIPAAIEKSETKSSVNQQSNGDPQRIPPVFRSPFKAENSASKVSADTGTPSKTGIPVQTGTPSLKIPTQTALPTAVKPLSNKSNNITAVSSADSEKNGMEPYDPIKENGRYFVDWPKPKAALVLTGLLDGYIEPCGCAGLDRMKGGLSRRATFLQDLTAKGWNLISLDTGKIGNGFGVQEELKFDMTINAFHLMNYKAIGIGPNELKFPAYFLLTFTAPSGNDEPSLFVSANAAVYAFNKLYTLPYKIIETGTLRIGFTSVLFETEELKHRDESILIEEPQKKLREIMPEFLKEKCDYRILVVHGSEYQTTELAKNFPEFNIILTSDSPTIPPSEPKIINGNQKLIELGEKGKYTVVLGLYDDAKNPVRYQRVALDSRYKSSEEVRLLMQGYQDILKTLITSKGYKSGLGLSLIEPPKYAALGKYTGSKKCESCHEEEFRIWRKSGHSTAWQSLIKKANPPRDFDPECISCHVIGWQGIENFPYAGGFDQAKTTPHLTDVGCESCHGAGEKHIAAELGDDEKLQDALRKEMHIGNGVRKLCYSCHDGDNSPEFDFDSYYKKIDHEIKDNK